LWEVFHISDAPIILSTAWSTGRPRILEETALSYIVPQLSSDVGRTYGRKEINNLIMVQ
jgi:hypothetical protein